MTDGQLLALAMGLIVLVLLPTIAFFVKREVLDVKRDINALGAKVNQHHDELLRDYVHEDRLKERMESALAPIAATLTRIDRTLETNVRELFSKMERKMDR